MAMMVSALHSSFLEEIQEVWKEDPNLQKLISKLHPDSNLHPHYTWEGERLRKKGKLVIGNNIALKVKIMEWLHNSNVGGHSGIEATLRRIKSLFDSSGMKQNVIHHIRHCLTCQR